MTVRLLFIYRPKLTSNKIGSDVTFARFKLFQLSNLLKPGQVNLDSLRVFQVTRSIVASSRG